MRPDSPLKCVYGSERQRLVLDTLTATGQNRANAARRLGIAIGFLEDLIALYGGRTRATSRTPYHQSSSWSAPRQVQQLGRRLARHLKVLHVDNKSCVATYLKRNPGKVVSVNAGAIAGWPDELLEELTKLTRLCYHVFSRRHRHDVAMTRKLSGAWYASQNLFAEIREYRGSLRAARMTAGAPRCDGLIAGSCGVSRLPIRPRLTPARV